MRTGANGSEIKHIIGEYALAGVDYDKMQPFKDLMDEIFRATDTFPNRYGVYVIRAEQSHGAHFDYMGPHQTDFRLSMTSEGLGNKNWVSERLRLQLGPECQNTYYHHIGEETVLMAVNDVITCGAQPVCYTFMVEAGDSDWYTDLERARDLANGMVELCERIGMAIPAGESASLKYLVRAAEPVKSAPTFSGCAIGITAPKSRFVGGENLQAGDVILGARSSGMHSNGISLVIVRGESLPDKFLTKLDDGLTFGEHVLKPTMCYVGLVQGLLDEGIEIHSFLPGTGDGVAKLAFDKRPFTYRVFNWLEEDKIPLLFRFMLEIGVDPYDILTTFNCGIGYYVFVPRSEVNRAIAAAGKHNYKLMEIGQVERGERCTYIDTQFLGAEPGLVLPPPGGKWRIEK